jgi:hypothetical protein
MYRRNAPIWRTAGYPMFRLSMLTLLRVNGLEIPTALFFNWSTSVRQPIPMAAVGSRVMRVTCYRSAGASRSLLLPFRFANTGPCSSLLRVESRETSASEDSIKLSAGQSALRFEHYELVKGEVAPFIKMLYFAIGKRICKGNMWRSHRAA